MSQTSGTPSTGRSTAGCPARRWTISRPPAGRPSPTTSPSSSPPSARSTPRGPLGRRAGGRCAPSTPRSATGSTAWREDATDCDIDLARATAAWDEALAAPAFDGPPTWVHGDLLAANLLVADGRLAGVLDWGGTGTGDPACDLYPAWVLDQAGRVRFRAALAVDDATWARGRGWALRTPIQGLPYYRVTNPGFATMSRRVLDQVLWGETAADG